MNNTFLDDVFTGCLDALMGIQSSFIAIKSDLFWAFLETVYLTVIPTITSVIIGFALAVLMIITGPAGLHPKPRVYAFLDVGVNLLRSTPFIILIIAIVPITRFVMGTSIGTTATLFPLTVAAAPFAARLIEGCFLEVDHGVIEAARSFGANRWQIIMKVMLPEAMPSIVLNIAVLAIALLGYSAMAGAVGGGGLGDLAYRDGYVGFRFDVTLWCIIALIIQAQAIQSLGNWLYRRLR